MEATAPSTSVQFSHNKEADDNLTYQLVDALTPGNSIICVSFVTAREVESDNIEHLKAAMAEYLSQHLQTPVRQVDLSIEVLLSNSMAASIQANSPALVEEAAASSADLDIGDEATNDAVPAKAKNKVPRPPNAFILYRKDWHPIVVAQNPGLHNNAISVIIGKKWKNESHEIRDKYQLKAAEAKHQHLIANPGYQYQPRKPSEKKKRMTKNKLAKLAARSAAAKSASTNAHLGAATTTNEDTMAMSQVTPLLDFNENKSMFSFQAGQGTASQLAAELNDFNNSKWSAAQQASYRSGMPIPASYSADTFDDSVNMEMVAHNPLAANTSNFVADAADDFDESAEDYFDEFAERDIPLPAFEDVDVVLPEIDGLATCEVFRQIGLNEELKDGLNDFFNFNSFE